MNPNREGKQKAAGISCRCAAEGNRKAEMIFLLRGNKPVTAARKKILNENGLYTLIGRKFWNLRGIYKKALAKTGDMLIYSFPLES